MRQWVSPATDIIGDETIAGFQDRSMHERYPFVS
jgi:hypothetical protein